MELSALIAPGLIFPHFQSIDRASLLRELAGRLVQHGVVEDAEDLYTRLMEREELASTGIGDGVAIPHCKVEGLEEVALAIVRLDRGIPFGARDEKPVRLFFCVVSPESQPAAHLQCLQAISRWLQGEGRADRLLALDDPDAIYQLLREDQD